MKKVLITLLVACTGCGDGASVDTVADENHGYGYTYDLSAPEGVRFRNDPALLDRYESARPRGR